MTTVTKAAHTPTPWYVNSQCMGAVKEGDSQQYSILRGRILIEHHCPGDRPANLICGMYNPGVLNATTVADANHIVACVNNHDTLIEVLECAFVAMGKQGANADTQHPLRHAWECARKALGDVGALRCVDDQWKPVLVDGGRAFPGALS